MTILISDISTGCFEGFANHRRVCEHFNALEQARIQSQNVVNTTLASDAILEQSPMPTSYKWYFTHSSNRHLRFLHDYIKHGKLNVIEQVALTQELDYVELQQGEDYTIKKMAISRHDAIQLMEKWNWKYAAKHHFRIREMFRKTRMTPSTIKKSQNFRSALNLVNLHPEFGLS